MTTDNERSDEHKDPTRLYIEGEQVEFDGTLDDIVEMAKSVGGAAFVYVPTEADQKAAAARLAAQDQALRDASGTVPQVTLDFDPRHNKWDDAPDPLWLLTPDEFERVPDGATLVSISGQRKVKGSDYIDNDTRGGCLAYGFLESQLAPSVDATGPPMPDSDERAPYPQVDVLAALMRRELDANRHKRDWRYLTTGYLLSEVIGHVAKLSHAIEAGDRDAILEHAADVANLSMMVADRSAGPLVAAVSGGSTHTRTSTPQGPDYCLECSAAARDWVKWPCPPMADRGRTEPSDV